MVALDCQTHLCMVKPLPIVRWGGSCRRSFPPLYSATQSWHTYFPLTLSLLNTPCERNGNLLAVPHAPHHLRLHLSFQHVCAFQWCHQPLLTPQYWWPSELSSKYGEKLCRLCATNSWASNWQMLLCDRLLHSSIYYWTDFFNKQL